MNSRPIGWTSCVSKRVLLTIRKWRMKGGTWKQRCSFRWRGALGEGEVRDLVQSNHRRLFREFGSNAIHLPVKSFSVRMSLTGKTSWQDLFSKVMLIWLQTLDFLENPMKALCVGKVTAFHYSHFRGESSLKSLLVNRYTSIALKRQNLETASSYFNFNPMYWFCFKKKKNVW